jgi:hypothetical protein
MDNNKESNKRSGQQLALFVFEAFMAALYLLFAVVCLFPSLFHFHFATQFEGIRLVLGIVLGIYGIFRIYRVIRKLR